MMKLFDSHCHLDDRAYDKDLDAVIARSADAGVQALMTVGTDTQSSRKAVSLAASRPCCYVSVGIHPHNARYCSNGDLNMLRELAGNKKVKAWGEIGLDFNRMYSSRKVQEKWFIEQLAIAGELDLPIIFHERDSNGRLLKILKEHPNKERKGVIHCFSGEKIEMHQYLEMGFYIGITGILTLKQRGDGLRKLVGGIPSERLVVETDAPYLTPAPEKNNTRRNEPAFVKSVLLKLAKVRGEDPGVLASAVWENSCRLYNITEAES